VPMTVQREQTPPETANTALDSLRNDSRDLRRYSEELRERSTGLLRRQNAIRTRFADRKPNASYESSPARRG
jgi:hypothetical protein